MSTLLVEIEMRGRMKALEEQRNRALADHAITAGSLAHANAENALLRTRIVELETQLQKKGA